MKVLILTKNYYQSIKINNNPNWADIPDDPYSILSIGGSESVKTYVLLNLIKYQRPGSGKIYLCIKDLFESKYRLLINGREKVEKI